MANFNINYLIVAGGGAGGHVGGGGAGGFLTNFPSSSTSLSISTAYSVTVGAGGASSTSAVGASGTDSIFNNITATGGGGGGGQGSATGVGDGVSGGSGGGAGAHDNGGGIPGSGNTPATTPSQGNNGGNNTRGATTQRYSGGGGGGAGSAGANAPSWTLAGDGGNGVQNAITGASPAPYYAGGGGGSSWYYTSGTSAAGTGGSSVGGNGGFDKPTITPATAGTTNTGSGGGANGLTSAGSIVGSSGAGGDGIVILRYATADANYTTTGLTPTETTDGTDTILSFTTVGTGSITFTTPPLPPFSGSKVTTPVTDFNKFNTEEGLKIPSGTTSNQPTGVTGMVRNDTTLSSTGSASAITYYNGTNWRYFEATESPDDPNLKMNLDASNAASYPGTGTTWFDLTSNANNGAISGASFSSLDGGYFSFDGSNDFVNTGSSTTKALPMSVEMWINPGSSFSPRGVIYSNYDSGTTNGFFIRLETSGKFQIDCYNKPAGTYYRTILNQTGSALPLNQWSHCVFTFDTSYVTAYLNGVLDAQVATNSQGIGFTSSFDTSLARRAGGDYFSGKISQARVYDVALTQAEIWVLYNKGR